MDTHKPKWLRQTAISFLVFAACLFFIVGQLPLFVAEPAAKPRLDLYGDPLPQHAIARLGTVRFLHRFAIWAIALSPDGKTIAVGSMPGSEVSEVGFWDVATGEKKGRLLLGNNILDMAWSPNGKRLAVAHSRMLEVWDVAKKKSLGTMDMPGNTSARSLRWSPDDKYIAAIVRKKTLYVWDADTGRVFRSRDFDAEIAGLSFSADGNLLAVCGDKILQVLEVDSFRPHLIIEGLMNSLSSVAFSPEGKKLAAAVRQGEENTRVVLWDAKTGKEIDRWKPFEGYNIKVAFTPDGKKIISGGGWSVIRLWDVAKKKQRYAIETTASRGYKFAVSADGKTLVSGTKRIAVWDLESGRLQSPQDTHGTHAFSAVWADNGKTVISRGGDDTIRYWQLPEGKQIRRLPGYSSPLAISRDKKKLAVRTSDGSVEVLDAISSKRLAKLNVPDQRDEKGWIGFLAMEFSPNGKELLTAGNDRTIRFWNIESGRQMKEFVASDEATLFWESVRFSPDGTMLAWNRIGEKVQLWNVEQGKMIRSVPDSAALMHSPFAFSPNSKWIATSGVHAKALVKKEFDPVKDKASVVTLWEIASGKKVLSTKPCASPTCIAISPDGKIIAASGWDKTIQLWSALTGKRLLEFKGHTDIIKQINFSADGNHLVSASQDTTLLVWDVEPARKRLK